MSTWTIYLFLKIIIHNDPSEMDPNVSCLGKKKTTKTKTQKALNPLVFSVLNVVIKVLLQAGYSEFRPWLETVSYASGVGNDSVKETCLSFEFISSFWFSLLVVLCGFFVVFFFLKTQSIILKPYNMLTERFIVMLLLSEFSQNTFVRKSI